MSAFPPARDIALLAWFVFPLVLPSDAPSVPECVAALQQRYVAVQSVQARFTQTYRAPGIEQVESGILFMKKPGFMRWEYRTPETKLFIADGQTSFLYVPEDRQVVVRALKATDLHNTPLQFLLGQGDLAGSFNASWEKEIQPAGARTMLLRLEPKSPQPDYAFVSVEFDRKTFELRRLAIRELTGNTSEFHLSETVTNVKIDPKQFQFKVPKGVEVVHMEDK